MSQLLPAQLVMGVLGKICVGEACEISVGVVDHLNNCRQVRGNDTLKQVPHLVDAALAAQLQLHTQKIVVGPQIKPVSVLAA